MESQQDPQVAELSEEEKNFLVCGIALALLALGATLRAMRQAHWSHLSLAFWKCYERLNPFRNKGDEDLRWKRYLHQEVCVQKVILARIYVRFATCVLVFGTLVRVYRILTRQPEWMSSEGTWFGLIVGLLSLLMTIAPHSIQLCTLNLTCIVWSLVSGFFLSSWAIPVEELLVMEVLIFVTIGIPLCTFAKHYMVVLLCQGGIMALVLARAVMEDLQSRTQSPGQKFSSPFPVS